MLPPPLILTPEIREMIAFKTVTYSIMLLWKTFYINFTHTQKKKKKVKYKIHSPSRRKLKPTFN